MDKSVIIFILLAVAFTAAIVGGLLFVYARRLPTMVSANKLTALARTLDARRDESGAYIAEFDRRTLRFNLSAEQSPYMHIYLEPVRGSSVWKLTKAGSDFHLDADPNLAAALTKSGLEGYLGPLRDQNELAIEYQPTTLHCSYQLRDGYSVPEPDAFTDQLRALGTIAHLAEQSDE